MFTAQGKENHWGFPDFFMNQVNLMKAKVLFLARIFILADKN